jgi:protein TonB
MAINNVDIYGDEWIELVFKDRNKSYGAYDLRKHYARTVLRALAITFFSIGALGYIAYLTLQPAPIAVQAVPNQPTTTVVKQFVIISSSGKKTTYAHVQKHTASGHPYCVLTPVTQHPAASQAINTQPIETPQQTAQTTPVITTSDETVYPEAKADVKPSPTDGAQGWQSYLQKNLVYPDAARHEGISGKVYLSFVVEKDGSISNIVVDKPAGNGFDEEAVRVLSQSPVWQPGIVDGKAIRIQYKLPITFRMVAPPNPPR